MTGVCLDKLAVLSRWAGAWSTGAARAVAQVKVHLIGDTEGAGCGWQCPLAAISDREECGTFRWQLVPNVAALALRANCGSR